MKSGTKRWLTGRILSSLAGMILLITIAGIGKRTTNGKKPAEMKGRTRTVLPGPPYFTRKISPGTNS